MNPVVVVGIAVALVGTIGSIAVALLNRRVSPQDLWKENRDQRTELNGRETYWEARDGERQKVIGILATALDILLHYIPTTVRLTEDEQKIINTAREVQPPFLRGN